MNAVAVFVVITALVVVQNASAFQGAPPAPVGVGEVMSERVQNHQMVTGELRAVHRSRVASEEPGVVAELRVLEGQQVEQGDVLAVLDNARLKIEVAQAEADLSVTQALVKEREADLTKATDDAAALRTVFEQRAANAKEMRDAEADLRIAEARLAWARLSVQVAEARRDLMGKRLSDTNIVAPYAGVIVARHVEVGEWLAEGAPIVDLLSTGMIEAWLNVPQSLFAGATDRELDVTITVDATDATVSTGEKRVIPQIDARARTFTLIATLPNDDQMLAAGMSVVGWVPKGAVAERLTVPSDAILRNETGAYVYAVRPMGAEGPPVAVPVRVQVLFPQGWRRVIESTELVAGDKVVVEGNERLFPMAPLQPMDAPVMSQREGEQGAAE